MVFNQFLTAEYSQRSNQGASTPANWRMKGKIATSVRRHWLPLKYG